MSEESHTYSPIKKIIFNHFGMCMNLVEKKQMTFSFVADVIVDLSSRKKYSTIVFIFCFVVLCLLFVFIFYCCAARAGFMPATVAGSHGCILFMRNNRSVIHEANVFGLMLFDCASNAAFCN